MDKVCNHIVELCKEEGNKYIYGYWNEPDTTMHKYGCYSKETKKILKRIENRLQRMCEELEDTLLIITADHGHVDGRNVCILDYPHILECLKRLPSIEPRALNLFVKEDKKEQFPDLFNKEFGKDFVLLTKEEAYESNMFGTKKAHINADGMLGDYVAIAKTDLTIFNTYKETNEFKGVHAGYTKEELTIPFIAVGK